MSSDFLKKKQYKFARIDIEDIEKDSHTLNDGVSFIVERKFPLPIMDIEEIDQIEFPADITGLTDDQLLEEMTKWTRLIDYTKFELAKAEIDKTAKWNRYSMEKAKRIVTFSKEVGNDMAKEMAKADSELAKFLKSYEIANAKAKLLDALLHGYNQNYKLLSRELTKRGLYTPPEK